MNIKIVSFLVFSILLSSLSFAQSNKYSRAKVSLVNKDIKTIIRLGIEADHGIYRKGKHLINDFKDTDIQLMKAAGYDVEVLIEDMARYYKNPNRELPTTSIQNRSNVCEDVKNGTSYQTPENYKIGSMAGYLTYEEMLETLDSMHTKYPHLISQRAAINQNFTVNGNKIEYIKISDFVETDEEEPEVLYTALHHAREPNSMSQLIFYMWYLLENYETDEYVKFLVDNTQMYFVPCVNPDGYIYNFLTDPQGGGFWRKNRNGSGVDLNRNYGYFWGYDNNGSSDNPSSETYRGDSGFSEKETQAIRELCIAHDFKIALNYHSYGNLLIHPWGYNDEPTEEDAIFKAFGKAMTAENKYKVGTALETVNYKVNGSSDDWMYGQQIAKNRIFSMTPEVGDQSDGFWPAPSRIDILNKSTLRQNFETAHLCNARFIVEHDDDSQYIASQSYEIALNIRNIGLKDGTIDIWAESNEYVKSISLEQNQVSLENLTSTTTNMNFDLSDNIQKGDPIVITLYIRQENFVDSLVIKKTYLSDNYETLIQDSFNTTNNWNVSNTWNLTEEDYVTAPSCMTDSPDANYANNTISTITLIESIDLSEAVMAFISFNAKWELENGYDYVQIWASIDQGETQIPLCGKYTITGNDDQDEGQPLYNGTSDWVLEEIDLTDYIGENNIQIGFTLVTDIVVTEDGYYFDDFKITQLKNQSSNIQDLWSTQWSISPNPTSDFIEINSTQNIQIERIKIYDVSGKLILTSDFTQSRIDIKSQPAGVYTVIVEGEDLTSSKRIVKQ